MRWASRSRMLFLGGIFIGLAVYIQMGFYLIHMIWGWQSAYNIFTWCTHWMQELGCLFLVYVLNAFVLGTFLLFLYYVVSQSIRSARAFTYVLRLRDDELTAYYAERYPELKLGGHLIVIHSHEPIALVLGLIRRRIVLSSGLIRLLDDREMEAVLYHEYYHLRHYDPLKTFFLTLAVSTLGYVPILKSLLSNYKMVREIMADRDAIAKAGTPVGLGGALLKLIQMGAVNTAFSGGVISSFAADGTVNDRIMHILEPDKKLPLRISYRSLVFSFIILISLFAVFNVVPM